jgi:predicted GIY-YIG superfamily endonuclease
MKSIITPSSYWTKENCHKEALKHNKRSEFKRVQSNAYRICRINKWLDDVCSHMEEKKKPNNYWTKEICHQEALKYNTRSDFNIYSLSAYTSSSKKGWLDDICSHMEEKRKPNSYWTYERCKEEALKYKTREELQGKTFYDSMRRNGWLEELTSHLQYVCKPSGYWTYERCKEEALKCKTRKELQGKTFNNVMRRNGWAEELTSHLPYVCRPFGYWTKERCHQEALKYNTRVDFQKKSNGAYGSSLKKGWLEEVCSHMTRQLQPNGYWTYERCKEEALKYNTRKEFMASKNGARLAAVRNGWIHDICSHMDYIFFPNNWWNDKTRCKEEVAKYKTREELRDNSYEAYKSIHRNGWWDELCSELIYTTANWNKSNVLAEALKYKHRSDFGDTSPGAYASAVRNGWLDEACLHMTSKTSSKERYIYVFEFEDNHAYIGLSFDVKDRKNSHTSSKDSKVYQHIKKTNSNYNLIVLEGPIPVKHAGEREGYYIDKYRKNNWNILNVGKAGVLGGSRTYWTKSRCINYANTFKKLSEFKASVNPYVFTLIRKNGWWDEVTKNLVPDIILIDKKNPFYWNYEICKKESQKFNSITEFQKNSRGAYKSAYRNNWLYEFFPMSLEDKRIKYWSDKDKCQQEALKYSALSYFKKYSSIAYKVSLDNNWLDDITSHMKKKKITTKEEVLEEALKYKHRTQFREGSKRIASLVIKNGWWEEACAHMISLHSPTINHWTIEMLKEESSKYTIRSEFQKNHRQAYNYAIRKGWIDEACSHMHKRESVPMGFWSVKENCHKESTKYVKASDFQKGCSGAYKAAVKNKWMNEFFPNTIRKKERNFS